MKNELNNNRLIKSILILIAFSLVFSFFLGSAVMADEQETRVFRWQDAAGTSFITVQSKADVDPKSLFTDVANLEFKAVNQTSPIAIPQGWQSKTYQIFMTQTVSQKLTPTFNQPVIYLIGETHLGPVQKQVARVMSDLIRDKEIDAVFIEQPNDLVYRWDSFKKLENNRTNVLAVLQTEMAKQADEALMKAPSFGEFETYFNSLKTDNSPEAVKAVLMRIMQDHGESGLKRAIETIKSRKEAIQKGKVIHDNYENGRYISASDYVYIMLNLQGLNIPFHNLESVEEREKFEIALKEAIKAYPDKIPKNIEKEMLLGRDLYMTKTSEQLIKINKYQQVILICGAHHTDNLKNLLNNKGYKVQVAFQSMDQQFKPPMAILVHPEGIVNLVDNYNGQASVVDNKLVVDNIPSTQVQNAASSLLTSFLPSLNKTQHERLIQDFTNSYNEDNLRTKPTWEVPIKLDDGSNVQLEKSRNALFITASKPANWQDVQKLESKSKATPLFEVDMENINRLQTLDGSTTGLRVVTVKRYAEGKSERYTAYNGKGEYFVGDSAAELVNKLSSDLVTNGIESIYLDLENFPDNKADAFSASVAVAGNKHDVVISSLRRSAGKTQNQEIFFGGHINAEKYRVSSPKLVESGTYKGWQMIKAQIPVKLSEVFHAIINVHIFVRTVEAANALHGFLMAHLELMSSKGNTLALSMPALMIEARREMKKAGFTQNDFAIEFKDESDKANFVDAVFEKIKDAS